MPGALLILQAGAAAVLAPQAPAAPPPTIELRARVKADSIRVERQGNASLTVHAEPLLAQAITVDRSKPVPNAVTVRNVEVTLDAVATVDPHGGPPSAAARATTTTREPQP